MSGKSFGLASLVATILGLGSVRGQGMSYPPPSSPSAAEMAPGEVGPAAATPVPDLTPSHWILYDRAPGCCGPTGRNGPLGFETYFRTGVSIPVAGGKLNNTLDAGWNIQAGARTLFFNPQADAAWTVDVGITNIWNHIGDQTVQFPMFNVQVFQDIGNNQKIPIIINPVVTGRALNRTFVNLALGREWYLWGSPEYDGRDSNWRVGFDVGGRYGSSKLEVLQITHRTDTIAGMFASVHSDLEVPWGSCIFQAGLRAEYGYTWSDILQVQNSADTQEINLMLTLGIRF